MNITEHRLNIVHQIDELSEESLCELEKIISTLKAKQKTAEVLNAFGTFDFDETYDYKKERERRS